ncbi:hypothetical protein Maq22A_4p60200 (plasmid) [Methylobacterium aquaticum]|uniref:Uncharacterized protein n=1 Tax=Methylobacterium aquaticum TaxID=270351 RepID=A0A0C6FXS1_9HYPH|nr:hypothetical protein Maq22A_4p60200 [Methylobacterium aquaticum]
MGVDMGRSDVQTARRESMPPKLKENVKSVRVPFMVPETWLAPVEEWRRAQQKIPSRGEAIRRLVEIGLEAERNKRHPLKGD